MRPFREHDGVFVASLNAAEAGLLVDLIGQVRALLAQRAESVADDPLAGLVGLQMGPSTPPEDPAVARLLPDFHHDDAELSAGLRMLREPEVIAAKDEAASATLATLPLTGGEVRLSEPQARAWLVALNDLRLAFGVRLGMTHDDDHGGLIEDGHQGPQQAEHQTAHQSMYLTFQWLSVIQESLASAMLEATA